MWRASCLHDSNSQTIYRFERKKRNPTIHTQSTHHPWNPSAIGAHFVPENIEQEEWQLLGSRMNPDSAWVEWSRQRMLNKHSNDGQPRQESQTRSRWRNNTRVMQLSIEVVPTSWQKPKVRHRALRQGAKAFTIVCIGSLTTVSCKEIVFYAHTI